MNRLLPVGGKRVAGKLSRRTARIERDALRRRRSSRGDGLGALYVQLNRLSVVCGPAREREDRRTLAAK